ncbi:hypothetical protein AA106556_2042 [Neokomagataea tanensis NBRC 106556]|uniref:Uncharacterized protein n=1 Tax=Neokomagataea tanensis NBRC 106556 TaxID=1223519 RepID=A0ABQ0QLL5_9PROT|nr:hypothetical protein AA106556_2042 [Neokomagataea tanensis NBRC 106556]
MTTLPGAMVSSGEPDPVRTGGGNGYAGRLDSYGLSFRVFPRWGVEDVWATLYKI